MTIRSEGQIKENSPGLPEFDGIRRAEDGSVGPLPPWEGLYRTSLGPLRAERSGFRQKARARKGTRAQRGWSTLKPLQYVWVLHRWRSLPRWDSTALDVVDFYPTPGA